MKIQEIYEYLSEGKTITLEDRDAFQIESVETLIHSLAQQHRALFHATRDKIENAPLLRLNPLRDDHRLVERHLEPAGTPAAFAANYPTVLLIKALFSNKHGLHYGYGEINQLGLNRIDDGVVNTRGYIYLLNNTSSFTDTFYSPWEKYTTVSGSTFGGGILVTLNDLPLRLQVEHHNRLLSREDLLRASRQV
jgi:hypothetical protein